MSFSRRFFLPLRASPLLIHFFTNLVDLACDLVQVLDNLLVRDLLTDPRHHLLHASLHLDPIMHLIDLLLRVLIDLRQLSIQLLHPFLACFEVAIELCERLLDLFDILGELGLKLLVELVEVPGGDAV